MGNFFDFEDSIDWSWTEEYKTENVFLIQSCYNAKWAQDLNLILSKVMPTEPLSDLISGTMAYNKNKKMYAYKCVNNDAYKKADKLLLVSGDRQFEDAYLDKKVYGIWHSSGFTHENAGQNKKIDKLINLLAYEGSEKILVASNVFKNNLRNKGNLDATVIGFPILDEPCDVNLNGSIIFNHRLNKDKHPEHLFNFPADLKKRLIVSAPKRTMPGKHSFSSRIEQELGKDSVFYNDFTKQNYYKQVMNNCGFGVSFAEPETFGYSVVDGIMAGLFYLVPVDALSATDEYMLREFMFNNVDELYEKIYYYSKKENFNERIRLVKDQQSILHNSYNVKKWIINLLKEVE